MRTLLLTLAVAAAPLSAIADECYFSNAFNDDRVTFTSDGSELAQMVPGGNIITCKMEPNTYARGPFPAKCTNGETTWDGPYGWFPSADGEIGALLLYADMIWYNSCAASSVEPK